MADYKVTDSELTSVASAIRTKGGTSASLSFPDGFVTAIGNISGGGGSTLITKSITADGTYNASSDSADGYSSVTVDVVLSGTFTVPASGTTYTLSFGRTISKYIFLIEATDDTKTAIVSSGYNGAKPYAFIGVYPKRQINNTDNSIDTLTLRLNPSTSAQSTGTMSGGSNPYSITDTSITIGATALTSSGATLLINGYSYKYYVAPID